MTVSVPSSLVDVFVAVTRSKRSRGHESVAMTPKLALNELDNVTRQVNNPAEFHEECRKAGQVLAAAVVSGAEPPAAVGATGGPLGEAQANDDHNDAEPK